MYYGDKMGALQDLFGSTGVRVASDRLVVGDRHYPIVDDVIVLLSPEQYPQSVADRVGRQEGVASDDLAEDIQFTFGAEWMRFPGMMAEHQKEFEDYFDLVDIKALADARVCDLGCGMGRWSHFIKDRCRELVLVDFSDAIFVARQNLRNAPNALFFMETSGACPSGTISPILPIVSACCIHSPATPATRSVGCAGMRRGSWCTCITISTTVRSISGYSLRP
jgi:hypothetical protein